MNTWIIVLLLIVGIALIIKGGDFFVDAAVWIAEISGVPSFIIGATIVSMATTLPELIVSMMAAGQGSVDMAVGNAIGSVTANVGLIMGISLFCLPSVIKRDQIAFKGILMMAAITCLWIFSAENGNALSIGASVIMLCLFALFIIENVVRTKKNADTEEAKEEQKGRQKPTAKVIASNLLKFILGVIGIVWGADLLVDKGCALAAIFGVPEGIIGVTIVAIGTSLPELVTTITAIVKKQSSLSVGNIIGANIIDLTVIMPLCAVVSGKALPVSDQMISLDMPACMLVCLIAMVPALIWEKFRRWQGVTLLIVYVGYVVLMCINYM